MVIVIVPRKIGRFQRVQTFYATRSTAGAAFVFLISSLSGRWAIVATPKSMDERIVCLEPTFPGTARAFDRSLRRQSSQICSGFGHFFTAGRRVATRSRMSKIDREEIIARIERIQELLLTVEKTCNESAENRAAFEKLKRELRHAHRALRSRSG
jgi:hypothetical protein